jgi:four helix bundle protein
MPYAYGRGMRVSTYEGLDAWRLADAVRRRIIELTRDSPIGTDRRFCDQIRSSAASMTANIAEGFGRYTDPEFLRFLRYARGSAMETREWLRDGRDRGHFSQAAFEEVWGTLNRAIGAITRLAEEIDHRTRAKKPARQGSR